MGALLRNTWCGVWIPAEGHITVFISERWPQTDTQCFLSSDTQMEWGARWAQTRHTHLHIVILRSHNKINVCPMSDLMLNV